MKKATNNLFNARNQCGLSWRRGMTFLFSSILLGFIPPLFADTPDTATGIEAPLGTYTTPPDIAAPSGTYAAATTAFAPVTSPNNAPFMVGGHLPILFIAYVSEVYDDNIFIQPSKTSDFITQIGLLGEYRIGNDEGPDSNYFDIFYAPSGDLYADHSAQDSFNQRAGALYQHRFSKLTLSLEQTYDRQAQTVAAVGNLVTLSTYVTKASASYDYSDKLSINGTFTENVVDYETSGYSNSNESVADAFFLYKLDSKLSIGIGPKIGWLDVSSAPNQTYEQILARVNYLYSGKLSFNLAAGAEDRQYQGPVTGDKVSPVFTLSASYLPFPYTTLTLTGQRQYNPSYNFYGQDYIATSVSFNGRHQFCRHFYYNLGLGYENDNYEGAGIDVVGPNRQDNYYFATTGFDWNPNSWLQASIYYKYQRDESNFNAFSFNDNQVGVSAQFSY